MRILEKGRLPETRLYITRCSHCRTQFEFQRSEARQSSDARDGAALIVACPLQGCGKDCWVSADEYEKSGIPTGVYHRDPHG